jgi:hypothetical protein
LQRAPEGGGSFLSRATHDGTCAFRKVPFLVNGHGILRGGWRRGYSHGTAGVKGAEDQKKAHHRWIFPVRHEDIVDMGSRKRSAKSIIPKPASPKRAA